MTTLNCPVVEVTAHDLPLSCPMPNSPQWSSHPRVSIDVSHGPAKCPYCGTHYRLKAGETVRAH
jgi:uncharacterized Zn-finger protein